MKNLYSFLLILITLFVFMVTVKCNPGTKCARKNTFDILMLSQTWMFSKCMEEKNYVQQGCPYLKTHGDWLIHGLWPKKLNSSSCPENCFNSNSSYTPDVINHLKEELHKKWTDLYDLAQNTTTHCFWKHEWEKHGSCGIEIDEINVQTKYFQKTLELFDKYNMTTIMRKAKIFPGEYSNFKVIFNRLLHVLGKQPMISCKMHKRNGDKKQYLSDIRLCFDKSFNLINCYGQSDFPTDCNNSTVIYPKDMPKITQTQFPPPNPSKRCN